MADSYDIFVSYSKKDWSRISLFVDAFRQAGLTVWVDNRTHIGPWSPQIEAALNAARYVVVFLTVESTASSFVFAEARRARERLVPVLLEDAPDPLPYKFDGLCALLQQYRLNLGDDIDTHPEFRRLCQDLSPQPNRASEPTAAINLPQDVSSSIEHWLAEGPSIDNLALAISTAVLETETLENIRVAAQALTAHLNKVDPDTSAMTTVTITEAAANRKSQLLRSRSRQLTAIHAVSYRDRHPVLGMEVERCRFSRPIYGPTLLSYIWRELDGLRHPLCAWLTDLASSAAIEVKWRLGLSLGILAQTEFAGVFEHLIRPWVLDETDPELRQAADIILSVAGYEPKLEPSIKGLLERWGRAGATTSETRAVVELVTGCTGGVFPEWAFATLRETVRAAREPARLLPILKQAMRRLFHRTIAVTDKSLWDIDALLAKLADWVEMPDQDEPVELPMFLFLCVLDEIPLTEPRGFRKGLSLSALVERPSALEPCVRLLSRALSGYSFRPKAVAASADVESLANETVGDPREATIPEHQKELLASQKIFRDEAIKRLKKWLTDRRRGDLPTDPVLVLAQSLMRATTTERDRDRLVFVFRNSWEQSVLEAESRSTILIEEQA